MSPPLAQRTTFTAKDGTSLASYRWQPDAEARGIVVIVHGYGHHTASFEELAGHLCGAGLVVCGFDQRGHGLSPGKRGHIDSFATFIDDLRSYLGSISDTTPDLPLFLLGHSLGGLIVGLYAIEDRPGFRGLAFSSPLLKIPDSVSPTLVRLGDFLGTWLPWLPVERVDYKWVSRDADVLETVLSDPLRHTGTMNARTGAEIARAIAIFQSAMRTISEPLLVFHGTSDRLTDVEGSRAFFDAAASEDKTLNIYEGGYHELFNDLERERFAKELTAWLIERC
ncbi:MAG: lysophospholipase [Candidatus Hydrogenedentota bacterium]